MDTSRPITSLATRASSAEVAAAVSRRARRGREGRQGRKGLPSGQRRYFAYCRKSSESEDRQVMSIASQEAELVKRFGSDGDISIIRTYTEAKSAKVPHRPVFDEMLACIEAGEAEGIVAWAPDRLARNSVDGGRIIYMLDQGRMIDLKFATYTFENNTQGKFMLQIAFAQSKHYSDNLSDVVRRGNRTKVEAGWWPNKAPIGYLNDPATRTVIPDPVRFPLVRRIFDLALQGTRPSQLALMARDDLCLRTVQHQRSGGKPVSLSAIYTMLRNPFYAGVIVWAGETHAGKHLPMISVDEFDRVAAHIKQPGRERPKTYSFPYTGMIRCGACGLGITAEHKTNRQGRRYIYYHCTQRRIGVRCREPAIQAPGLERQIAEFLGTLTTAPEIERLVLDVLKEGRQEDAAFTAAKRAATLALIDQKKVELAELTTLRVRSLIEDAEFVSTRAQMERERLELEGTLARIDQPVEMFEPFEELFFLKKYAAKWLLDASDDEKRKLLKIVCSNPTLKAKKLSIQAAKPLVAVAKMESIPKLLGVIADVRTPQRIAKTVRRDVERHARAMVDDPEFAEFLREIRVLRLRFDPASLPSARSRSGSRTARRDR